MHSKAASRRSVTRSDALVDIRNVAKSRRRSIGGPVKAMILAAGRGARMKPLTDTTPKPLLPAGGRALIEWQIDALVRGGFDDLVINHAWLGDLIETAIGDGRRFGARIAWSRERSALETLGGIVTALPLIAADGDPGTPFAVVSADIHSDFDYASLHPVVDAIRARFPLRAAHLVLVENPAWHPAGDMVLDGDRVVRPTATDARRLTYANIAVFHPGVFAGLVAGRAMKLFPWAYALADAGRMTGSLHPGGWLNVGTPDQLADLDHRIREHSRDG